MYLLSDWVQELHFGPISETQGVNVRKVEYQHMSLLWDWVQSKALAKRDYKIRPYEGYFLMDWTYFPGGHTKGPTCWTLRLQSPNTVIWHILPRAIQEITPWISWGFFMGLWVGSGIKPHLRSLPHRLHQLRGHLTKGLLERCLLLVAALELS